MARLYDRVVARRSSALRPGDGFTDLMPSAYQKMAKAPVIVVDNVAEYFFAGTNQEVWSISNDFPNLAPPFPWFWMETRRPTRIVSEVTGETSARVLPQAWGAFFGSEENPSPERDPRWRWRINAYVWIHGASGVMGPCGGAALFVDAAGAHTQAGHPQPWSIIHLKDSDGQPIFFGNDPKVHEGVIANFLNPLLLAISFMHCKNVGRREVVQPGYDRQLWFKKHKRPLVRYHVLDIDPVRKVLKSEGRSEEVGLKKALHICRGHFATYTDEAPLFGRVTGTFWKPQHVRGNAKHGAVVKDYRVNAPRHDP